MIGLASAVARGDDGPGPAPLPGQPGWVESTLRAHPEAFGRVFESAEAMRAQVVVAVLERDGEGPDARWVVHQDAWRADTEYFYPASAIKLPGAVAALAEAGVLARSHPGFDRNTPLKWHALSSVSKEATADRTSPNGRITLAWEVRKALVISDNDAYSRLFEFAGHRAANERLWQAGLKSVRLWHRLNSVRSVADNRRSPRIDLAVRGRPRRVALLPERQSDLELPPTGLAGLDVGLAYLDPLDRDSRIEGPMSFREKNAVSLVDLQRLLVAILRPEVATPVDQHALGLSESDREFLVGVLGESPAQLNPAIWKGAEYDELQFRPALAGVLQVRDREALEVRGKAGRAFGFHVENAFFFDKRTNRGLFLAAAVHVNADGVLNDDKYEYDTVSRPFMANLGRVFAHAVFTPAATPSPR